MTAIRLCFGRRDFGGLSLSPDGRRAAISLGDGTDAALYLADANGGALTPLTKPAAWTPVWSPDGKWIAGSLELPNTSGQRIARVLAEAGRSWEELFNSENSENVGQWTPDGKGLLFNMQEALTGRRSIAVVAMDSSPPTASVVVDGGGQRIVQYPALSPDGRWLAYESNESGRAEVYVQSYPEPTVRMQLSRDGGTRPLCARNGSAIYIVTGSAIVSRTVTAQPELRFGDPRTVVNDPPAPRTAGSVLEDVRCRARRPVPRHQGRRQHSLRHVVVMQNWLDDARARMSEARK